MIFFLFSSSIGKLGDKIPLKKAPGGISYYLLLPAEIRSAKPSCESLPLSQWRFLEKGVVGKTVCMEGFVGANPGWLESCKLFCMLRPLRLKYTLYKWSCP